MGKKINELTAVSDATAKDDNQLLPLADPSTGVAGKMTIAQAKAAFSTKVERYTATGSEGTTLTISALSGRDIILIIRESGPLFPVLSSPTSTDYIWNDTTITLGLATNPGERFIIHHKAY